MCDVAVAQLKDEFSTEAERTLFRNVVNWPSRWSKMKAFIKAHAPDVMVLVEADHMEQMQVELAELVRDTDHRSRSRFHSWRL